MAKRIVAIIGTYRKGRVIDTAVCEVLRGAEARGAQTQRIYLLDRHIEFCTNCRSCTQEENAGRRGQCVQKDDMDEVLQAIDATAYPGFIAWFLIPGPRKALKIAAKTVGAKVTKSLCFGSVAQTPEATLSEKDRRKAYRAGQQLADALGQSAR
jgi:hypothetical protein